MLSLRRLIRLRWSAANTIPSWPFAVAALALLACPFEAAGAENWKPPSKCKTQPITGIEDATGDEPFVSVYMTIQNQSQEIPSQVQSTDKGLIVQYMVPKNRVQFYTLVATYTPFLQIFNGWAEASSFPGRIAQISVPKLSDIDQSLNNNEALYDTFWVKVLGSDQKPVANAFVDFIPQYGGASPYTMQADGDGLIKLNCFVYVANHNPVTVSDQSGTYLYDGSITLTDKKGAGTTAPTK